ncbi:hypothetical protein LXA43DRAFT_1045534 [Ganoderma leucocontextum]|nr:hypothetical protein LXA43DRAFT_1045534 [Ganoderma leucocontextum]
MRHGRQLESPISPTITACHIRKIPGTPCSTTPPSNLSPIVPRPSSSVIVVSSPSTYPGRCEPPYPITLRLSWSTASKISMNNYSDLPSNSTLLPEVLVQYESTTSTIALIFYEYIATLPTEVAYFWCKRITGASLLFYANRYLVLAYSAALLRGAGLFTTHASDPPSCVQWSNGVRAMEILAYIPWAAFSGLRVYALRGYASGWALGALVFLLSIVPVCINFADFRWAHLVFDTLQGCSEAILESPGFSIRLTRCPPPVTVVSRVSLILADVVVIITTWMSTYGVVKTLRHQRGTLSEVLLRNGDILLLLNTMHLAFCARSVSPFASITSILVSRFMLSLQTASGRSYVHSDSVRANATTLTFERVVGSIGAICSETEDDGDITGDSWCADGVAPPMYGERDWDMRFRGV